MEGQACPAAPPGGRWGDGLEESPPAPSQKLEHPVHAHQLGKEGAQLWVGRQGILGQPRSTSFQA